MAQYPTQLHYHDTKLASHCPILVMLSTQLSSDNYQFCKSFDLTRTGIERPLIWINVDAKWLLLEQFELKEPKILLANLSKESPVVCFVMVVSQAIIFLR